MAQVFTSHLARLDIEDIWNHLADDDVEQADKFVQELSLIGEMLALNPHAGKLTGQLINSLRRFPFHRYIIYYFPVVEGIEIYRVIHSSRDIAGSAVFRYNKGASD